MGRPRGGLPWPFKCSDLIDRDLHITSQAAEALMLSGRALEPQHSHTPAFASRQRPLPRHPAHTMFTSIAALLHKRLPKDNNRGAGDGSTAAVAIGSAKASDAAAAASQPADASDLLGAPPCTRPGGRLQAAVRRCSCLQSRLPCAGLLISRRPSSHVFPSPHSPSLTHTSPPLPRHPQTPSAPRRCCPPAASAAPTCWPTWRAGGSWAPRCRPTWGCRSWSS